MKQALITLLLLGALDASGGNSVALMPLDNVSGEQAVYTDLPPLIVKAVEAKGWTVAGGDGIDALLEKERVRYLDSLDANIRKTIVEKSGANAILAVTVYTYAQGRNPGVALSARLIDAEGTTIWADITGLTSADTVRALGLGKKETVAGVAEEAVDALMRRFPRMIEARPIHSMRTRTSAPHFTSPDFDRSRPICVLPFDNDSASPDAPRVLADVLAFRLAAAGFDVVDPATLRAAALEARISFHAFSPEDLATLAKIVGTPLFLRGTVYAYDNSPLIDVETTLVDAAAGKVLWAAQNNRKGSDYIGFLMLGAVSNSVSLTDRVAAEMIATTRKKHENPKHSGDRAPVASVGRASGQSHAGEGQR